MSKTLTALLAASLFSLPIAANAHIIGDKTDRAGVLHVTATASANTVPDTARVSAGVQSEAETAREAMRQNSAQMQRVFDALEAASVANRNIATSSLNLRPNYNYDNRGPGGPTLIGYVASNQITITSRDIDSVGALLDAIINAGVNTINNVEFTVKDSEAAQDKARADAIAKARGKAVSMAGSAGVQLGELLSLTEGSAPGRMFDQVVTQSARMDMAAPPMAAGQREISSTVTLTYAID